MQRKIKIGRKFVFVKTIIPVFMIIGFMCLPLYANDVKQKLFERVFGGAVQLDPDMVNKVRKIKPGERILIDRDNDGKNDEAWYIDTSVRHTEKVRPLLVRAIDEDGDLDEHMGPDLDSDLYVADWNADGTVDAVLDYQDNDGDNDVDEMAFFFWLPKHRYFGKDSLGVWWGSDDGDDNLLWYDVNYTYYQRLCQYRCHFSGDESFVAFGLKIDSDRWLSAWENPFLFYDPDNDGCSEVVLRIEGKGDYIRKIRYSFDVDNDSFSRRTHDYDFSITTVAEDNDLVGLPKDGVINTKIRGIPTQSWLQRDSARQFVSEASWGRALLTWDEVNANTDGNIERDPNERWEGLLNHASDDFPQVGGPACSPLNKRNEVAIAPKPPLKLYYDPTDRRLHLKGASKGWLHVDYNFDGQIDAKYTYIDDDIDGIFDRRQLDLDADGAVDFEWKMKGRQNREFNLDFESLNTFYVPMLKETLANSQKFIDTAKAILGESASKDPVERYFLTELQNWVSVTKLGERIRKTPAGARFYIDLFRDRLFWQLEKQFGQDKQWPSIEEHYASGGYGNAARLIDHKLKRAGAVVNTRGFKDYSHRIAIGLDNAGSGQRDDWPVTLNVNNIREKAADFNPHNCAVVAPQRWLDWRQIPHQVDEIDPDTGEEISFLVDLPENAISTYYIYYSPTGVDNARFPLKTGTAEDWVPPNIGWESNRCAYRAYWGQFDFFGKKTEDLIYENIGSKSYHQEVEWGIDALHVGKTSGIGGLTVYEGDRAYPIQNPEGKGNVEFTKRVLTQGPIRCAIEITARNVIPAKPDLLFRLHCLIYAERQETEIRVTVGDREEVVLAPGLVKLPREQFFADLAGGYFGSWGWQEAVIDEIGMGLMVSPQVVTDIIDDPDQRRIKCSTTGSGKLRYWLIGDWRRGRQHPIAPTVENWRKELQTMAGLLLQQPIIEIAKPEKVK
ncbi:MAG: DUF4861 family protein [Planctomycetota bacterium]|nr:MAG: DUF4861 family protein [Planctomycetota bacterium]